MNTYVAKLVTGVGVILGVCAGAGCDLYFGPDHTQIPDAQQCQIDQDCIDRGVGNQCHSGICYISECFDPGGGPCIGIDAGGQCGDGQRADTEACDDGNQQSGDGCSADCSSTEACGNGLVDTVRSEQCDDGNSNNSDTCGNDCKLTVASCAGTVTCALLPPTCIAEEVPLLVNGCYTGECRLIAACDVPPTCAAIRQEAACLARTDCEASYTGRNCQQPDGSACRAGDTQCVCESFSFAACATGN